MIFRTLLPVVPGSFARRQKVPPGIMSAVDCRIV
jgi:hypothetical protein